MMKHNVLFYNSETDKSSFQLQSGIRPWGILMLITAGRYTLELPNTKQTYTISANTMRVTMCCYILHMTGQMQKKISKSLISHIFLAGKSPMKISMTRIISLIMKQNYYSQMLQAVFNQYCHYIKR